ncbi:N-terminal nucleophile aminohydrolase [Coniochaeta hoffmannii]|uniref:N-terminal nucleophile aminohydrolase n=1 Tax=Coniochaeta hoffmannii TaxID=91930 RepID=A0AA38RWB1_9PEZI|nr:N-terminal nucleophile aminohydrolase [Coniochaeta hoffmannii]
MEYKTPPRPQPRIAPRLIIHGGAGNIKPSTVPPEKYAAFRAALLDIVTKIQTYMHTTTTTTTTATKPSSSSRPPPDAIAIATFAVRQLEDNPLFNAGRGAVFTRDGVNELEASVMVSRGRAKRGVGVMGLRRVRNPILLARELLERGDVDLRGTGIDGGMGEGGGRGGLDVPSAQGHTQIHGEAAESLARRYGLDMVEPGYFFTQARWDEHVRALEREREGKGLGTWSREEYLPQGTVGAIALDAEGMVCCATSTGGLTNKLTGRIGDTPVVGAGFWAEEWVEDGDPTGGISALRRRGPMLAFSGELGGLLADCLPTPFLYSPVDARPRRRLVTTRSMAVSGTGNGDSFLRVAAARTVGAIARFAGVPTSEALTRVTGPSGELQKSAGSRWGRTGEGEGGIIGIELAVVTDEKGDVVETRSEVVQDFNCGAFRDEDP